MTERCSAQVKLRVSTSVNKPTGHSDAGNRSLIVDNRLHRPLTHGVDGGGDRRDCSETTTMTPVRSVVRDQRRAGFNVARPFPSVRATHRMQHVSDAATSTTHTAARDTTTATATSANWKKVDELIPKAGLNVRRFRPAPSRDPRSGPLLPIRHQSVVESFGSVHEGLQQPSVRRSGGSDACSWRTAMSRLYSDYGYQFSSLYRPAARAPPPHRLTERDAIAVAAGSWTTSWRSRTHSLSMSDATQAQHGRRSKTANAARCGEGSVTRSGCARTYGLCQKNTTVASSSSGVVRPFARRHTMR